MLQDYYNLSSSELLLSPTSKIESGFFKENPLISRDFLNMISELADLSDIEILNQIEHISINKQINTIFVCWNLNITVITFKVLNYSIKQYYCYRSFSVKHIIIDGNNIIELDISKYIKTDNSMNHLIKYLNNISGNRWLVSTEMDLYK
jgi:hypothetical protein